MLWKDCTTRGAVVGGFLGLLSSVRLALVSPAVWKVTLGNPKGSALFPYASPALFSMTIGFMGIGLLSILDRSPRAAEDRAGFEAQQIRSETGIGASGESGRIKRGADLPIAVLVPLVVLKKRLDIERLVAGRIPRLAVAVEDQLERL